MRSLDHDLIPELMARLRAIPEDAAPRWGKMSRTEMIAHLVNVVRYSMGRAGAQPVRGSWIVRHVAGPLILRGVLPIPRNVRVQRRAPTTFPPHAHDDLETLQALLEEYLQLVQADELSCPPHPLFGDLGVDGWARFHLVHFEHHLRQFGR